MRFDGLSDRRVHRVHRRNAHLRPGQLRLRHFFSGGRRLLERLSAPIRWKIRTCVQLRRNSEICGSAEQEARDDTVQADWRLSPLRQTGVLSARQSDILSLRKKLRRFHPSSLEDQRGLHRNIAPLDIGKGATEDPLLGHQKLLPHSELWIEPAELLRLQRLQADRHDLHRFRQNLECQDNTRQEEGYCLGFRRLEHQVFQCWPEAAFGRLREILRKRRRRYSLQRVLASMEFHNSWKGESLHQRCLNWISRSRTHYSWRPLHHESEELLISPFGSRRSRCNSRLWVWNMEAEVFDSHEGEEVELKQRHLHRNKEVCDSVSRWADAECIFGGRWIIRALVDTITGVRVEDSWVVTPRRVRVGSWECREVGGHYRKDTKL